jgi:membrane protease YdiL (CAAX protease family)
VGHPRSSLFWPAIGFALVFPSLLSLADFVLLARGDGEPNPAQQLAYGAGKLIQFGWPLLCVWLIEGRFPRPAAPTRRGLGLGLGFGLLVAAGTLALYYVFLRDTSVFTATAAQLRQKMEEYDVASPGGFALFAAFVTVPHSLLEEYYWRWFVFGWLRRRLPLASAIAVSAAGFMAHHMIILHVFFPGQFFTAVVPFSLCVSAGGAVWAWLYERSGSIYAPWLSHLLVDAALFVVGYDLFFVRGA